MWGVVEEDVVNRGVWRKKTRRGDPKWKAERKRIRISVSMPINLFNSSLFIGFCFY